MRERTITVINRIVRWPLRNGAEAARSQAKFDAETAGWNTLPRVLYGEAQGVAEGLDLWRKFPGKIVGAVRSLRGRSTRPPTSSGSIGPLRFF